MYRSVGSDLLGNTWTHWLLYLTRYLPAAFILIFASCPRSRRNRPRRNIFIRDVWQHLVLILVRPQRLNLVQAGGNVAHQIAHDQELIVCDAGASRHQCRGGGGRRTGRGQQGSAGSERRLARSRRGREPGMEKEAYNLHVFALQETLEGESR